MDTKIYFTSDEIRTVLQVTADLYTGRKVSSLRLNRMLEITDRAPYMSFKKLCELAVKSIDTVEGQDIRDYLCTRFDGLDAYGKIARGV